MDEKTEKVPFNAKLEATRKSTKLRGEMTKSDVVFRVNSGCYWGDIVKSCDKTWCPGGGNGNPPQASCCRNPISSMKRQKDRTPGDEPPPPAQV